MAHVYLITRNSWVNGGGGGIWGGGTYFSVDRSPYIQSGRFTLIGGQWTVLLPWQRVRAAYVHTRILATYGDITNTMVCEFTSTK